MSHSTAEAGELSPRDPVEGRGHRQVAPVEGKTANTPRLGPVSTSRQRIAELARQALGMAVAIAWLPGPAGTRRRVAKPSVEEPDTAEPARPDLWGARVSNDPGLPDRPRDVQGAGGRPHFRNRVRQVDAIHARHDDVGDDQVDRPDMLVGHTDGRQTTPRFPRPGSRPPPASGASSRGRRVRHRPPRASTTGHAVVGRNRLRVRLAATDARRPRAARG